MNVRLATGARRYRGCALASGVFGFTAANAIPQSSISTSSRAQGANDLKPSECDGIVLTSLVTGAGLFSGTAGNDLILASSGGGTRSGLGGRHCILGGAGGDIINGAGDDVIFAEPGSTHAPAASARTPP